MGVGAKGVAGEVCLAPTSSPTVETRVPAPTEAPGAEGTRETLEARLVAALQSQDHSADPHAASASAIPNCPATPCTPKATKAPTHLDLADSPPHPPTSPDSDGSSGGGKNSSQRTPSRLKRLPTLRLFTPERLAGWTSATPARVTKGTARKLISQFLSPSPSQANATATATKPTGAAGTTRGAAISSDQHPTNSGAARSLRSVASSPSFFSSSGSSAGSDAGSGRGANDDAGYVERRRQRQARRKRGAELDRPQLASPAPAALPTVRNCTGLGDWTDSDELSGEDRLAAAARDHVVASTAGLARVTNEGTFTSV